MWDGTYSSIHGGDLNNDNSLDFVLGNQSGGVALFTSEDSIYIPGISEFTKGEITLELYPNPANKSIRIEINCGCNDVFDYKVYDLLGNLILSHQGKNESQINVQSLENGIYFIQAENKNRSIRMTERFIKSN